MKYKANCFNKKKTLITKTLRVFV